jgi:FixJ family two-component response regulator
MNETDDKIPLISVVDDDESVRAAMERLVSSFGFDVCTFDSAEQYLTSAQRRATACIVSDIQMPGTTGLEMKSHLVAQNDHTPIIFITAYPQPEAKKRALDAGAVCFLVKPFDGQTLINCIERALRGDRSEHEHA